MNLLDLILLKVLGKLIKEDENKTFKDHVFSVNEKKVSKKY